MDNVKLLGIEFDLPTDEDVRKWDYRIYKEGKTTFKELWLYNFERTGSSIARQGYLLKTTNRNVVTLDDKRIKDPKEIEIALKIFESLKCFGKL